MGIGIGIGIGIGDKDWDSLAGEGREEKGGKIE